jgi:CDP-paratose 2-epimerase
METPIKKKMLVTGSTGLVGSEAVQYFSEQGWEVIGIDNNGRSQFFDTERKVPQLTMDIRDSMRMEGLFESHTFDAIIHTAAQPSHDWSKENVMEDFTINAFGTVLLLELARKHSPNAVFVHCSTDKVYGEGMDRSTTSLKEYGTRYDSEDLFDEETPIKPALSPFGVSKLAADFYVQEYAAQGWLTTGVFRMGCITGRRHEGAEQHGFLAYLAKCIKEGKTYNIYGYKGKQVRDQIHGYDLVSAFDAFIQNPRSGGVYNIGGGPERSVSVLEAGARISSNTGKPFNYEVKEKRFGDRQWDVHDVSKFRKDYPEWDYKYSLDDIINDLCHD